MIAVWWGYLGLALLYWLVMAVNALRVARWVPQLDRLRPPEPDRWPSLSILVPACNEAEAIEEAVASLLRLDYPNFELILIDDRSTDRTGELIDRIAASDGRVRPVHITALPDGWLGKVHALARGVELAHGDWLLMTDADVHLAPDTLRRVIAWCEHRHWDHLAASPDLWSSGLWFDALVSSFVRLGCVSARPWAVENPRSKACIGIGAFNLVRRSIFARSEGFPWLRLEVTDDVGLGYLMKRSGGRSTLVNACGFIGLHWYRSLAEMARGVEKAYATIANCSLLRMVAICLVLVAMETSAWTSLATLGTPGLRWVGVATFLLWLASVLTILRWARRPILPGLLSPLAILLGTAITLRAGWLGFRRGGVIWRGTLYPSKLLREGRRVPF